MGSKPTCRQRFPCFAKRSKDKDVEVRKSAALVLVRAGLEIETALPILFDKSWSETDANHEQSHFQGRVIQLHIRRQPSTAPAAAAVCCKAWQAGDQNVRGILESWLLDLQPESLPHLLDQLHQAKTRQAKRDLAHLLARFEGQGKLILPILREELRGLQPEDQYTAAKSLMLLGPDAADAVPDLVRLLNDREPGIRVIAAEVLGSIGRAARPAVPKLKEMLNEVKLEMRLCAAPSAVPKLAEMLKEDKLEMRLVVVADALSRIDTDVSEALAGALRHAGQPKA